MQAVNIRTTQNVQLEYPLAGIGERLLAFVIDAIIIGSFFLFTNAVASGLGFEMGRSTILIIAIIAYLYRFLMEVFFNGQTVGKMTLNIRVVKLDGSPPSIAAFFLRWLMEVIDFGIVGLAVLLIILTRNGQRLGDILGGTTVVKIKRVSAVNMQNKVVMGKIDPDYEPSFPDAAHLTDHEIRLIKSALTAYREEAHSRPLELLCQKLKEKYQIETDLPPVRLLYILLRDHAYYVSQ